MTAAIAINTNSPHYRQVPPGTEVLEVPVSNTLDNPVAEALEVPVSIILEVPPSNYITHYPVMWNSKNNKELKV